MLFKLETTMLFRMVNDQGSSSQTWKEQTLRDSLLGHQWTSFLYYVVHSLP